MDAISTIKARKTYSAAPRRRDGVDVVGLLRSAGLRPTQQRRALAELLFAGGGRHITAECLREDAMKAGIPVSLATIYNTLNQFTDAGLLRELAIDANKTYFDTTTHEHHHYFVEGTDEVFDIPEMELSITDLPEPPEGMEIARVDVVVRLRPKS
ncbi:Fur family iron response transcriptional regulator [Rhodobium orientis]|nr:Fur family transcriptional regulator [Rhodobium orientis]MBB4302013.1 Fur family iron response transcriptional regulator [Rhodobium orientis]